MTTLLLEQTFTATSNTDCDDSKGYYEPGQPEGMDVDSYIDCDGQTVYITHYIHPVYPQCVIWSTEIEYDEF